MKSKSGMKKGGPVTHGGERGSSNRKRTDHGARPDRDTLRNHSLEGEMSAAVKGSHLSADS